MGRDMGMGIRLISPAGSSIVRRSGYGVSFKISEYQFFLGVSFLGAENWTQLPFFFSLFVGEHGMMKDEPID